MGARVCVYVYLCMMCMQKTMQGDTWCLTIEDPDTSYILPLLCVGGGEEQSFDNGKAATWPKLFFLSLYRPNAVSRGVI